MALACAVGLLIFTGGDLGVQPMSTTVAQVTDTVQAPAPTAVPTEVASTKRPPPEPTKERPPEPAGEEGSGPGPELPCLPVAGVLFAAPRLVLQKRQS